MKTLSEVRAKRAATRAEHQKAEDERRAKVLRLVETIEAEDATRAVSMTADERNARASIRNTIRAGGTLGAEIACDRCGVELFYPTPNIMLLDGTRAVACPGCGVYEYL